MTRYLCCLTEEKKNDMLDRVTSILPANATLISLDYNGNVFGNIVVVIKVANTKHTFITDRDEIYHNGKMLCDSSYHYFEKEDAFSKLLQMIKRELCF